METNGEERVTLAILGRDIAHIIKLLEDANGRAEDREKRLRHLEGERVPTLENRATRIEERQGVLAGIQAAYTTLAAALLAVLK